MVQKLYNLPPSRWEIKLHTLIIKANFLFLVKPGNYTITVTHVSYKKIEQAVRVEAGTTKNIDFDMIPNEQLGE